MSKFSITAIMPTCGRTICIGESIYSFLNQNYQNKNLIILDTHPQDIQFNIELPINIRYIKEKSHNFKSLGEKFKYLISLINTDLFCIWEDDDIWLENHFNFLTNNIKIDNNYTKIGNHDNFSILGGVDKPIHHLSINSNLCWCKYLFTKQSFENNIEEPFDVNFVNLYNENIVNINMPQYIYRWDNGQCHMSGLYGSRSYEDLYRLFEDDLCSKNITSEIVKIEWRHNYQKLCEDVYNTSKIR